MRKLLIEAALRVASYLYKRKRYCLTVRRANLGCGMQCLPGWANIDGSLTALLGSRKWRFINRVLYHLAGSSAYYSFAEFDRVIRMCRLYFADLRNGVPLGDGSMDVMYCSHFLEHLGKHDGERFLTECKRVLRRGGLLRLAVPDLDVAFAMYRDGECGRMLELFFYTSEQWDFSAHKYNYNFDSIRSILDRLGYTDIRRFGYRQGECEGIEFLDVLPEHSLYVECRA